MRNLQFKVKTQVPCLFLRGCPNSVLFLRWGWGTNHLLEILSSVSELTSPPYESTWLVLIFPTEGRYLFWLLGCEGTHCKLIQWWMTCSHYLLHHASDMVLCSGSSTSKTSWMLTVFDI